MDIIASSWSKGGSVYYVGKGGLGLVGLLGKPEDTTVYSIQCIVHNILFTLNWHDLA